MSKKEKQATAKQAFVFLLPLLSEQPVKQAIKHEVRVHDIMKTVSLAQKSEIEILEMWQSI